MLELYGRIKARRIELGMSQEQLAKMLGYKSRSSINKIEKGLNDISQTKIVKIARALQTTPEWLMGGSEASESVSLDAPEIRAANDISKAPPDAKFLSPDEEEAAEEALGSLISAAKAISKIVKTKITSYDDENRVNYVMSWDREECQMIVEYRGLSEQDKNVVRSMIHSLNSKNASPALKED